MSALGSIVRLVGTSYSTQAKLQHTPPKVRPHPLGNLRTEAAAASKAGPRSTHHVHSWSIHTYAGHVWWLTVCIILLPSADANA